MELQQLFDLMDKFEFGTLYELEYTEGETHVKLRKGEAAAPNSLAQPSAPFGAQAARPAQPAAKAEKGSIITAPLVGNFYAAAAAGEPAFASVGDTIKKGQTVCIIEAMKMINEIPAPVDCVIEEVFAKNEELVGFGAPLFRIREQ